MKLSDLVKMDCADAIDWIVKNHNNYVLVEVPTVVDCADDISIVGDEILCWNGLEWSIDCVEFCQDKGIHYMANGTKVEAYVSLEELTDEV